MLKNTHYAWLTFHGLFLVSSPPLQKNQHCINEVLFIQQADSPDEASLKYAGNSAFIFILFLFHVPVFQSRLQGLQNIIESTHIIKVENCKQVTTETNCWETIQKVQEMCKKQEWVKP